MATLAKDAEFRKEYLTLWAKQHAEDEKKRGEDPRRRDSQGRKAPVPEAEQEAKKSKVSQCMEMQAS